MRVYVESYGCSQNQGEGAGIARDLAARGHTVSRDPQTADVGILVTCGVIGPTESRMVRRWNALAARIPRVVVTGCLVPLRTDLMSGPARERTTFVPIREQDHLPALLDSWSLVSPASALDPGASSTDSVAEEVVIAQGCTSGCSYCFSRLARGRLASVPMAAVVRRVGEAVERGAREIRLTGLDTAAWGEDLLTPERLPELVRATGSVPGDFRMRVGMMSPQSLEPHRTRYFETLGGDRTYHFLHLPVQSGSDAVLERMRRGYTSELFLQQVEEARRKVPDLHLATDLIVGFPGETEEDFERTEELLERAEPETVNVTRFSARPGTTAARMRPVGPRVAKRRSRALAETRQRIARRRLERWIGEEAVGRVLEYGPDGSSVARLSNYLPVVLSERPPLGSEVRLRVDGARTTYLLGSLVSAASKYRSHP